MPNYAFLFLFITYNNLSRFVFDFKLMQANTLIPISIPTPPPFPLIPFHWLAISGTAAHRGREKSENMFVQSKPTSDYY